jgi:YegS/Rv2252/BmrU family lipid kinase
MKAGKMTARPLVIVNPASAGGKTNEIWTRIASELVRNFGPFDCCFTDAPGDAQRLAFEAANAGRGLIVACGGDGTISEVANGIITSGIDVELGVLPSGTGGDFRRSLEISSRTAEAARVLKEGKRRRMDVGRVAYIGKSGKEESRYFVGVASFGMSGEIIERVKKEESPWLAALPGRWLGGKAAFARAMLETTLSSAPREVVVTIDQSGGRVVKVVNFCVANAKFFGGGMKVAPNAAIDDGYFDVIEIGDLSSLKIFLNSPRLYAGAHLSMDEVVHQNARTVTAHAFNPSEAIPLEVDGELPGHLPARFEIVPSALSIRCR